MVLLGALSATLIGDDGPYSKYALSGALSDGTSLDGKFISLGDPNTTYTVAPKLILHDTAVSEPGSVALLVGIAIGGAGVLRRRRK